METSTTRIAGGFVAAFVLLALNAAVSYTTLGNLVAANNLVANSEQSLRLLVELRAGIVDAVESVIGVYEAQRQAGERFLDTYRRIGAQPFKDKLYAD